MSLAHSMQGAAAQAGASRSQSGAREGVPAPEDQTGTREGAPDRDAAAGEKGPGVLTTSDALEERRQRYRELMDGEFRDLFEEDTRRAAGRMRQSLRELEARAAASQPVLDMLMDRYKIAGGDMGKLLEALENDDAYWSQAAGEAGMNVEQFKQFQKLKRENAALLRQQRRRLGQEKANAQFQSWDRQTRELKAVYPHFDLARESRDPNFISMLRAGVPLRQAFEVIHMDDIKAATAAMQARATEKAVTDGIRARGARPQENGTGAASGFTVKDDVSRLTAKDRAEIARRVARGETISF